jgi:glycosyltransferase involved in cell wall biosynthesis
VIPTAVHVASGREWRGGQRQVWLLARELQRQGHPQVVVTGGDTELARRLQDEGVRVRAVNWQAGLDPRVLAATLGELRNGPAVLHAHDAHAVTLAGVCGWLARAPLVATRRVDFHLQRKGFWARADRVIAISRAVASVLIDDGIRPERVVVVHSGIALDSLHPVVPMGIRSRLELPPDTPIAVNVAALVPHKDHATLFRAAAHLRERWPALHWIVAGEGELRPQLEALREELALRGRVHLIGQVEDPLPLIADANVFVMSSREEGLGTTVLDAMASGIPVASTAAGGLPEMLGDGAGLLVPPENPAALAAAVEQLMNDPAVRAGLIERAFVAVRRFGADRMATEVRSVYRSCVPFL